MKKITQKELIIRYLEENEFIIPAKMGGREWNGGFFGSETPKRCRELRQEGILESEPYEENPKFEKFYLKISESGQNTLFKILTFN
jgi:hypothetical protein